MFTSYVSTSQTGWNCSQIRLVFKSEKIRVTEHSENKVIVESGLFEKEIGPGLHQSSIQQTLALQNYQKNKT